MRRISCIIWLMVIAVDKFSAGDVTACTTEDTDCSCIIGQNNEYKLTCDRINPPLANVPLLTSVVTELDMFKTPSTDSKISSASLRPATGLIAIRIESCDITTVEVNAFNGLYSMQTLNLANNHIRVLPGRAFSHLTLLQSLDLSFNSLENLPVDVFDGLKNLKHLDLSFNSLQSIPEQLFRPLESLKTLKLENTLLRTTVLPDGLLSHLSVMEVLNLNDNKITQLQPQLLANNRLLREVSVKGNNIKTVSREVFESLSQLVTLDLGENPFVCDCQLLSYKQWLDTESSKSWGTEKTGSCASPAEIQSQPIANLPADKFICPTTVRPVTYQPTTTSNSLSPGSTVTPETKIPQYISNTDSSSTDSYTKSQPYTGGEVSKATERSIIIGSCVGAAFLFMLINVLIVCCVRHAKRHTGTLKTKYIIRPDTLDEEKESGNDYATPYKQARVDGTSNGYIISNGVSGFYHTGSRSKLYGNDLDCNLHDPEFEKPSKLDTKLNGDSTDRFHNNSIFSIPLPEDEHTKYYPDYQTRNQDGSYHPPNIKYTDHRQTLASNGTWPTHGTHRVRFNPTDQMLEPTIYTADSAIEIDSPRDYSRQYPGQVIQHPNNIYNTTMGYFEADEFTDTQSQEFVPDDGPEMKHSTGSGDSGVHSDSPCQGIEDMLSPSLPHRHIDEHMVSIHELDQSHISIGSKKIRNVTYV